MPRSIFAKVVAIMVTMAICLVAIVSVFFVFVLQSARNQGWRPGAHAILAHEVLLVAVLMLMGGVILSAHVVLRRLLEPLHALNDAVEMLGAGQLDVQLPIHTNDEFGRLAHAFNQMVERVREMIQSRDRLLVDVSHELRSPLTRMKVALALPSDSAQRGRLADDVAEMEHMVSELLELERLRTAQGVTVVRQDLLRILYDTASRYDERTLSVRVVASAEEIMVEIDGDKIRTVLRNLIENSIKYAAADSRPVELRAVEAVSDVIVRITDDGVGIPADDAERVFEPFFRVDPSRSKRTSGYGLGLSICKRVMEAHGGTIAMERLSPRGTAFVLTFPRPVHGNVAK